MIDATLCLLVALVGSACWAQDVARRRRTARDTDRLWRGFARLQHHGITDPKRARSLYTAYLIASWQMAYDDLRRSGVDVFAHPDAVPADVLIRDRWISR